MFGLIGSVLIVFGVVIAVMAGLEDLDWYFIFIAALVMGIGSITYRAPHVYGMLNTNILIKLVIKGHNNLLIFCSTNILRNLLLFCLKNK